MASLLDWSALAALKQYDLFVSCVDNPTARYAATFIATLYLRPLLDVATGVFLGSRAEDHRPKLQEENFVPSVNRELFRYGRLPLPLMEDGTRTMGADVRLAVPGSGERSGNCLLCLGGGGNMEQVRHELSASPQRDKPSQQTSPFWEGRAGSLDLLSDPHDGVKRDDMFRHRLALAAMCMAEIDPAKRNLGVMPGMKNVPT